MGKRMEILFEEDIAWRIEERRYHPDEQKTRLPDGRLRYQVRSSAQWEIVPWVLSFGPLATLVKPASWRRSVTDMLAATLPRYEETHPTGMDGYLDRVDIGFGEASGAG